MVPQNHEGPGILPKVHRKHPSVTFSRGSRALGQKDLDLFVFCFVFFFFPSLPPFSLFSQQLFIKRLWCVRLCAGQRGSKVEPDRQGSHHHGASMLEMRTQLTMCQINAQYNFCCWRGSNWYSVIRKHRGFLEWVWYQESPHGGGDFEARLECLK